MGFWRGFGYFLNIIGIIICLLAFPIGLLAIWIPILLIYVLRKGAKNEDMRKDIHEMTLLKRDQAERQRMIEQMENKLVEDQRKLEEIKKEKTSLEEWK